MCRDLPREHGSDVGIGLKKKIRVFAGRESYVVVLQPNLAIPPVVLVDEFSQVDSEPET